MTLNENRVFPDNCTLTTAPDELLQKTYRVKKWPKQSKFDLNQAYRLL
jgi:hypothetical protein